VRGVGRGRLQGVHQDRFDHVVADRAGRPSPGLFTELLAMFSGLARKLHDEAETVERPKLERVA